MSAWKLPRPDSVAPPRSVTPVSGVKPRTLEIAELDRALERTLLRSRNAGRYSTHFPAAATTIVKRGGR